MSKYIALIAGLLVLPTPLSAQSLHTVSAGDPDGMVKLLDLAGFEPKLGKDTGGDPKIDITVAGYHPTIFFYGCDKKAHTGCDSVQLQSAFDRKQPWPASEAIKVAAKWRFGAVYLDNEGDPVISWDIVTGDGIPSKVFLEGLRSYGDTIGEVADMVFPADGSQNTSD